MSRLQEQHFVTCLNIFASVTIYVYFQLSKVQDFLGYAVKLKVNSRMSRKLENLRNCFRYDTSSLGDIPTAGISPSNHGSTGLVSQVKWLRLLEIMIGLKNLCLLSPVRDWSKQFSVEFRTRINELTFIGWIPRFFFSLLRCFHFIYRGRKTY